MKMITLLYVSTSTLDAEERDSEVRRIVDTALYFNPSVKITGALLFTGSHFAQVLEGFADDVDELMKSIQRDRRHEDVRIMDRSPIDVRRFPDWSMAYSGPSAFVSGFVTRLLNASTRPDRAQAVAWLTELMAQFGR